MAQKSWLADSLCISPTVLSRKPVPGWLMVSIHHIYSHCLCSVYQYSTGEMAPRKNDGSASKGVMSKGAWTAEEDTKLAEYIELHGPKRWKTIATKSGLNRCGKSCRLRWLNYLRPNIKRGNISDEEDDLILRLYKLLGNRWSLIAGRLPGRTDNEIKNYWNSHLSKKITQKEKTSQPSTAIPKKTSGDTTRENEVGDVNLDTENFFDFSTEDCCGLEWVNEYLELDEDFLAHQLKGDHHLE